MQSTSTFSEVYSKKMEIVYSEIEPLHQEIGEIFREISTLMIKIDCTNNILKFYREKLISYSDAIKTVTNSMIMQWKQ